MDVPPRDLAPGVSGDEPLSFPDGPRSELDRALADLVERANAVANTQGRLRALLQATRDIIEETDLSRVLQRVVEAAVHLVGARYGAMGVIARDGTLERFIHVGVDPDVVQGIGHLPRGRGLLGAVIVDPVPIRIDHIAQDARSAGFPSNHPPMDSFLGVPVRVRDRVFGNLYLTESAAGGFTDEDEQLVVSLAGTAGFAIENARLLQETRIRADWAAAAVELTTDLLGPTTAPDEAIAAAVARVAPGCVVCVVRADEDSGSLVIAASAGPESGAARPGTTFARNESLVGEAIETGAPVRSPGSEVGAGDPLRVVRDGWGGALLAIPLGSPRGAWGAVTLARDTEAGDFEDVEVDVASDLVERVAVAIELVRARAFEERTLLLEDRGRIARDLHDHVIQDLFGTGLELQALAGRILEPREAERLGRAVERIDDAITQIRSIIFATSPFAGRDASPRHRVMDLAAELSATRASPIAVRFSGPVDHAIDDGLLPDVIAVARELLTNAVRHSRAQSIAIRVDATSTEITITVTDDGIGLSDKTRESGLGNIRHRAVSRGGRFEVDSRPGRTAIRWRAPAGPAQTDKGAE